MDWKIPLADLEYGPEEDEAVLGVLHSKWLTIAHPAALPHHGR